MHLDKVEVESLVVGGFAVAWQSKVEGGGKALAVPLDHLLVMVTLVDSWFSPLLIGADDAFR